MKYYRTQDSIVIPLEGEWVLVQYENNWEWYLTKYNLEYQSEIERVCDSEDVSKINYIDRHIILKTVLIWRRAD